MHTKVIELLNLAVANKASDLHLMVGILPKLRVNGELVDIGGYGVENETEMKEMILSLLTVEQKEVLEKRREIDFSLATEKARFRVNVYYRMGFLACVLRVVPSEVLNFTQLGLPDLFNTFVKYKQGFILVTGPTGQGKSTTVASILNEINMRKSYHIVTVEDPIEYVLKSNKSIISQREVGFDTKSFAGALKSVFRQDPNVVYIGEMRDLETIAAALTIAETGHLVFSTLHTNSAAQTIDRIVDVFPEGSKEQIRTQLASVVTAVVSQRLVPTVDGGRAPAFEILIATPAVRNLIREGKSHMIDNIIQTSADVGMMSLDACLAKLGLQGKITEEVALGYCLSPVDFQARLRKVGGV